MGGWVGSLEARHSVFMTERATLRLAIEEREMQRAQEALPASLRLDEMNAEVGTSSVWITLSCAR